MIYYTVQSNGLELRGIIHQEYDCQDSIIVIIHGYFSSNKIGPHRLYYQIAQKLNEHGFITIRMDLSGMGESDGNIEHIHFENHVEDLNNIISDLEKRYLEKKIILIGHCIGCNILLAYILKKRYTTRYALFLAPAITSEKTVKNFFCKDKQLDSLKKNGFAYRRGLYADASFFNKEFSGEKFAEKLKRVDIEYSIIIAGRDQYIDKGEIKQLSTELCKEPICIEEADHNFLDPSCRRELLETIVFLLSEKMS